MCQHTSLVNLNARNYRQYYRMMGGGETQRYQYNIDIGGECISSGDVVKQGIAKGGRDSDMM